MFKTDKGNNFINIDRSVIVFALVIPTDLYLSNLKLRSQYLKRFSRYGPNKTQQLK